MNVTEPRPKVLLTGATGCIGGRLLATLEAQGHAVRCMTRRPAALAGRTGRHTSVVRADCLDPASLPAALAGIDTACYLVHSMGNRGFDRRTAAARTSVAAAAPASAAS